MHSVVCLERFLGNIIIKNDALRGESGNNSTQFPAVLDLFFTRLLNRNGNGLIIWWEEIQIEHFRGWVHLSLPRRAERGTTNLTEVNRTIANVA